MAQVEPIKDVPDTVADPKADLQKDVSKLSISTPIQRSKRRRSSAKVPISAKPRELITKEKKRKNQASTLIEYGDAKKLKFSALRELSLFLLNVTDECPTFFKVRNRASINKVVMLVIPGINPELFNLNNTEKVVNPLENSSFNFFNSHFKESLISIAPGEKDSVFPLMKAFTTRPFTKSEKTKLKNQLASKKLILPDLEMSLDELLTNGYPIHPSTKGIAANYNEQDLKPQQGWVDTTEFEHGGSHTFALDCEMCEGTNGKVLTRISMIDFEENVIMDELVKPDEEIIDYLTEHSGITQEKLQDVTTTLQDIQSKILKIVSSSDYLIGHSLENDLNVLKIRHPKIIDTALVFEHPRGPPFKSALKYLTNKHLDRIIQQGSHDSIEDSRSCLDLVKLKLVEGGLLGKVLDGQSIFKDLSSKEKKGAIIDYFRVQPFQDDYFQCKDDDGIVETVIDLVETRDLVVGNLKEIEFNNNDEKEKEKEKEVHENLDKRLETIYEALPTNTAFIITTGTSDQSKVKLLLNRKREFNREFAAKKGEDITTTWTIEDEVNLKELVQVARTGVSFITFKTPNDDLNSAVTE